MAKLWSLPSVLGVLAFGVGGALAQPEPEVIGVVFHVDPSSGTLTRLPREQATVKNQRVRFSIIRFGYTKVAELPTETSPLRLRAGHKHEFVVRFVTGVDPLKKLELYRFDIRKSKREYMLWKMPAVTCDVTKLGESSYKFTSTQELAPGEYGFSPTDSNDVFSFGIDPAK